jgi:uncharacterized protein YecT (DUF1311 family)
MRKAWKIAFLAGALALSGTAMAQQHSIDQEIDQCKSAKPNLLGQIECELMGYQKWNAEMERLYNQLLVQLDEQSKLVLKEEQLAWATLRDVHFEFYEKFYGRKEGQYLTLMASSKTDFVRQRARELQLHLNELGSMGR